ncbi:L-threonylcarbamoyladenylate synthase [Halotalea alkalilenta]|uniref:Threonylcarbamoyl-AMP synthase n=1 Tax=Halotalea alkalilenta TaxID=376489 RepID=A0A172YIG4_9GAMM|nr:Sua5/YciO/YrdC/YwlC family protein [Halotalea alkalilenta]ANF59017.1 tRNA threonylcarbamoyladenosine biosynthesis protein RimN [Halotalea alkalilenta]
MTTEVIADAAVVLRRGGIVAYPTEAVWGLGCDPDDPLALERLLGLKRRDAAKGLILIAASIEQFEPWLSGLDAESRRRLAEQWPGPLTWLVPDNGRAHPLIRGAHDKVALRVTAHPLASALCDAFGGPLVSTSANLAGSPSALSEEEVRRDFGDALDAVVSGALGGRDRPSEIRDLATGKRLRT